VKAENATYGDIIRISSERIKSNSNFYQASGVLQAVNHTNRKSFFLSKLDDDSFLNARGFYQSYLALRIEILPGSKEQKSSVNHTLIGRRSSRRNFNYRSRQFIL